MAYADYNYYSNVYLGTLPEDAYNRAAVRADAYLDMLTFGRASRISADDARYEKLRCAACACAELYAQEERGGLLASAENDGYRETYAVGHSTIWSKLYTAAATWLGLTGLLWQGGAPGC